MTLDFAGTCVTFSVQPSLSWVLCHLQLRGPAQPNAVTCPMAKTDCKSCSSCCCRQSEKTWQGEVAHLNLAFILPSSKPGITGKTVSSFWVLEYSDVKREASENQSLRSLFSSNIQQVSIILGFVSDAYTVV